MAKGRYPRLVGKTDPHCPVCPQVVAPVLTPVESEGGQVIALSCTNCGSSFKADDGQVIRRGREHNQ